MDFYKLPTLSKKSTEMSKPLLTNDKTRCIMFVQTDEEPQFVKVHYYEPERKNNYGVHDSSRSSQMLGIFRNNYSKVVPREKNRFYTVPRKNSQSLADS